MPDTILAASLVILVARLAREMSARQPPGLSVTEMAVLTDLDLRLAATPGELAAIELMRPPSMSRHLAQLRARGLITEHPHPEDRRQINMALTSAGREALEESRRGTAWLGTRMAELDSRQLDTLIPALAILAKPRWHRVVP